MEVAGQCGNVCLGAWVCLHVCLCVWVYWPECCNLSLTAATTSMRGPYRNIPVLLIIVSLVDRPWGWMPTWGSPPTFPRAFPSAPMPSPGRFLGKQWFHSNSLRKLCPGSYFSLLEFVGAYFCDLTWPGFY